ncbi:MAG: hypothetical protein H7Y18_17385 [Clostridiaceae bacterium]|nr:hypothetical protein [Clostridiaceae bacterium]
MCPAKCHNPRIVSLCKGYGTEAWCKIDQKLANYFLEGPLKERLKMTRVGIELRNEGIEEGMKEGIKEGIKVGIKKAKLEDASKMITKGYNIDDIIEITGLRKEEVRKLYELRKEKH